MSQIINQPKMLHRVYETAVKLEHLNEILMTFYFYMIVSLT